jgi:hypothetical protein
MLSLKGLEIVNYQDKLYYVYRRFSKTGIKEGFINEIKDLWHCDMVLKKRNEDDETLIFLVEISDAVIIEDPVEVEKN